MSVTSDLVLHEYYTNVAEVQKEYNNLLSRIKNDITKHFDYCELLKQTVPKKFDFNKYSLTQPLWKLLQKIDRKTICIREQQSFSKFAHYRVKNKIAPAANKSEYKDCYIWGTCLDLSIKLKVSQIPILFFTTNKTDYQNTNTKSIHSDIENDTKINNNVKICFDCGEIIGFLKSTLTC